MALLGTDKNTNELVCIWPALYFFSVTVPHSGACCGVMLARLFLTHTPKDAAGCTNYASWQLFSSGILMDGGFYEACLKYEYIYYRNVQSFTAAFALAAGGMYDGYTELSFK